jgi:hypothetical protein
MARQRVPLKLCFNEGIFRLSEKPDVRGKPFGYFSGGGLPSFGKVTRPRGRNPIHPNTQSDAEHQISKLLGWAFLRRFGVR